MALTKCIIGSTAVLFLLMTSISQADTTTTGEKAKKEVKEAAAAIGDYSSEQKDAAMAKAKELMENLDARMEIWEAKMESNWQDLKASSQENYIEAKQELKAQRDKLSEWYDNMKESSADAWDEVKEGFSKSYDELSTSFNENEKQLNTGK